MKRTLRSYFWPSTSVPPTATPLTSTTTVSAVGARDGAAVDGLAVGLAVGAPSPMANGFE